MADAVISLLEGTIYMESFDPAEEAAWQHALSPTAHTDRVTQRKRDFLAGIAWSDRHGPIAIAVQRLQREGCALVPRTTAEGDVRWRIEWPLAVETAEKPANLRPPGMSFADPLAALLDFAVSN